MGGATEERKDELYQRLGDAIASQEGEEGKPSTKPGQEQPHPAGHAQWY